MKLFTKLTILLGCTMVLASGCIKETQPTSIATTEQIGKSASALDATVGAIPAQMVQGYLVYGTQEWEFDMAYPGLMIMLDSAAGEIVDAGETGYDWYSYWSSNSYQLGPTSATSYVPWRTAYMFIKSTNDVIGAINPEEASELQLQYLAKALAVRSFVYLYLAQIYEYKPATDPNVDAKYKPEADVTGLTVPIITEKTGEAEGKANPRASKEEIYAMIMGDLESAEEYLASTQSNPSTMPTLAVAYGIHAKAFLALEQYAEAAEYADKAIKAFGGSPLTQAQWEDPINGFNNAGANSNSWMWYLAYSAETMGNLCNFVAHMSPEATWTAYSWAVGRGINKNVYDKIPDSDWRKHSWIDPQGTDYYAYKVNRNVFDTEGDKPLAAYTSLKFRPSGGDYATYKVGGASHVPIMRIEEMHFIKAEGLAMSGRLGEAKEEFNTFMRTRNPEYDCSAITVAKSFQSELIFQKRVEFWGEGIIFYDFKRLGYGILNGYEGTNVQGGYRFNVTGVAPWWNWTIPQSELNGNPVLQGYNNPDPTKSTEEWQEAQ